MLFCAQKERKEEITITSEDLVDKNASLAGSDRPGEVYYFYDGNENSETAATKYC
jgi:hypothetical protein